MTTVGVKGLNTAPSGFSSVHSIYVSRKRPYWSVRYSLLKRVLYTLQTLT